MNKIKELFANKMIRNMSICIISLLIIILVISVIFSDKKKKTYESLSNSLIKAATSYYSDHPSELPVNDGETKTISTNVLIEKKYIKNMKSISPRDSKCSGEVFVSKKFDKNNYSTRLDCGNSYKDYYIKDAILSIEKIVNSGDGLYKVGNEYVFRGQYVNNYLNFANRTYRIIKIYDDGAVSIISEDFSGNLKEEIWDDRYNKEFDNFDGVNSYELSRIKKLLDDYLKSNYFLDSDRAKLVAKSICVGGNDLLSNVVYNSECNKTIDNQYISLISLSNYLFASVDPNCKIVKDGGCANYNYLSMMNDKWWTGTPVGKNTKDVMLLYTGYPNEVNANEPHNFREVLTLDANNFMLSGNGKFDSPYVLK